MTTGRSDRIDGSGHQTLEERIFLAGIEVSEDHLRTKLAECGDVRTFGNRCANGKRVIAFQKLDCGIMQMYVSPGAKGTRQMTDAHSSLVSPGLLDNSGLDRVLAFELALSFRSGKEFLD